MAGTTARSWLANLPRHWSALPLGYRYSVQLGKMLDAKQITGNHSAPYLRNVDVQWGRVNVADLPEMDFDAEDRVRFTLRAGDLLACEGGEIGRAAVWQGHIKECYYQKALHRVRAISTSECPQFLYYCFHAAVTAGAFTGGTGMTTIEHLPAERLRKIRFPFPPGDEQTAIADFLDRETARIDALVGRKRRLLELLEEKRLAVITHAVTKGIDPNAPMKHSGIDWLGQIPAHWDVARIKQVAKLESGHTPSRTVPEYWVDCDIKWVSLNDTKHIAEHDYIFETTHQINALGLANSSARLLPAGTVVFTRDATIGLAAITGVEMAVSQHLIAWVPGPRIQALFLLRVFDAIRKYLDKFTFGATIKTIGMDDVRSLYTPLPPIPEQAAIAQAIAEQTVKIDKLKLAVGREIQLLQEYRSALITNAVTGKIDVRGEVERKEAAE